MIRLQEFKNADFDRGAPVWKEALWHAVKSCFFLPSWPWPSCWRLALLRAFGAHIGKRVVVRARVNITFPWRLTIGDDVWIGEDAFLLTLAPICIENDVCISQRVFLCTGSHNFHKSSFDLIIKPIIIRQGTWIAAQAFVAPGVDVGEGSVVSAGSVVLSSVPPGVIVRGNPAAIVDL